MREKDRDRVVVCIILDQERRRLRTRLFQNIVLVGGRTCDLPGVVDALVSPGCSQVQGLFNSTVGFTSFSKSTTDMFAFECILCRVPVHLPSTRTRLKRQTLPPPGGSTDLCVT